MDVCCKFICKNCFKLTSLLWDLNEDRSNPYLNALQNRTPENVCDFLSKWNRGRGYRKNILTQKLASKETQEKLKEVPSRFADYLRSTNAILKGVTGKSHQEYIGSVKLAHIYHPDVFPLIDNPILKEFKLNSFSQGNFNSFLKNYIRFKNGMDKTIKDFDLTDMEVRGRGIYKLLDEILYLFITQGKREIVEEILGRTGNYLCVILIDNLIQELTANINNLLN